MRNRYYSTLTSMRAQFRVRVPVAILQKQIPQPPQFLGLQNTAEGLWESPDLTEFVDISETSWSVNPETLKYQPWQKPWFVEPDRFGSGYVCWTGFHTKPDPDNPGREIRTPLSEEVIGQYREFHNWLRDLGRDAQHPVVGLLNEAGLSAAESEIMVDKNFQHLIFRFGVKFQGYYSTQRRRFCGQMKQALKTAKRMNLHLKVMP